MKRIEVLENLRGFAALYVCLGHFLPVYITGKSSLLNLPFKFGQEAVMLFFLLSGFVIQYSFHSQSDASFKAYFIRRFRRIYPLFLLSLVLSYVAATLSARRVLPLDGRNLLGNLLMLHDFSAGKPGVWFNAYYGNGPLWSLAYEWWFYMMFYPIARFVPAPMQKYLVCLLSFVGLASYWAMPNQVGLYLMYFITWWTGAEIARTYCAGEKPDVKNQAVPLLLLSSICVLLFSTLLFEWKVLGRQLSFGIHPVLEFRHFAFSLIAALVALSLPRFGWQQLARLLMPFSVVAPVSYALYVLHTPLAIESTYLSFVDSVSLQITGYVLITISAVWFAEFPFQRYINRKIRTKSSRKTSRTVGKLPVAGAEVGT